MEKQGLIIGIDYTNKYCQASYYNARHDRVESVMTGAAVMRYLIPAVICYDEQANNWLIGEEATLFSEKTGTYLFKDLLTNILNGEIVRIDDEDYSYERLLAAFFGKIIELIQIRSGLMNIESICVNLRKVDLEIKGKMENVFLLLKLGQEKVRFINCAESFAYYMLNEDQELWRDGALLFDFGNEGFYAKQLSIQGTKETPLLYVNERNYSMDFNIRDLASELLRIDLDKKLCGIYQDIKFDGAKSSVFFTGEGFSELWFRRTLETISEDHRAFKGNNLYVKGACLAAKLKHERPDKDIPVICRGRTKAFISVVVLENNRMKEKVISNAAVDWYDAGAEVDFLLVEDRSATVVITSLVSRERTKLEFDLSSFPARPKGTTRVGVSVKYVNSSQCEITMRDKGFGSFFPASGETVSKRLDLEGYI